MNFQLVYISRDGRNKWKRSFSSIKTMTQYVRRDPYIKRYRYFLDGEPISVFGTQIISLREAQSIVKRLTDPL
jgi:hypothetical protein